MIMNNKAIGIAVLALVLGLGAGYALAGGRDRDRLPYGMHRMGDGSMMADRRMGMEDMMEGMNAALAGKTGDAFDAAFIDEMIVHHQGAVRMAEAALASAKRQEIKDLARGIIDAQEKEIAQMQEWRRTWYAR